MEKHFLVKESMLYKVGESFSDINELFEFMDNLAEMIQQISKSSYFAINTVLTTREKGLVLLQQLFTFAVFCRNNIEEIREMISKVDYIELTEDEIKGILERFQNLGNNDN